MSVKKKWEKKEEDKVVRTKILVLGSGVYGRPFQGHGDIMLVKSTKLADEIDWATIKLVVFTGGADVDPSLYSEKAHATTHSDINRDKVETEYYHAALRNKVGMVGICRGSQFLTVMNGGRLVQHVSNHAVGGTHSITTKDNETFEVTSTHHQMMFPQGRHKMLAWAEGLSQKYEFGSTAAWAKKSDHIQEPEVVWYGNTKGLAVQFHPEYMNADSLGYNYFQDLLKEYVL